MKHFLNIALMGKDFFLWSGGTELLRNLANALLSTQKEHKLRIFLLLPGRYKVDSITDLQGIIRKAAVSIIRKRKISLPTQDPILNSNYQDYFKNVDGEIEIVEYNTASGLIPALKKIEADVVLPAVFTLGETLPFPWVGYVYDFQHKYFPDYFSARECMDRDIYFATMLRDAKAVIVNSRSVKDDIGKFFPYCDCEVFNLPFSAAPVTSWFDDDDPDQLAGYNLPERYFLISNQFWIHKSHRTAFQALSMLLKDSSHANLHIVCTGKMEDYRHPDHIQNLQQEIRELGVEDKVHFLGHIPKIDQIVIMKKSLAVLQPTLFEGGPGGGSVYDAVSLGVPAILSDIPVNKEIENEENLFYFQAGSAVDLAEKIKEFLNKDIRRPSRENLILRGEQRKRLLGECLLEAIHYVSRLK